MPKTNKKRTAEVQTQHFGFFIDEKTTEPLLKVVPNIDGREGNGSPDISRGFFFDSTEKFIPLCHE